MAVAAFSDRIARKMMHLFTATILVFLSEKVDWKLPTGFGLVMTVVGTSAFLATLNACCSHPDLYKAVRLSD